MLVFRNQTAYSRFWNGRCHINTVTTAVRCLARQFLVLVPAPSSPPSLPTASSMSSLNLPGSRTPRFLNSPSTTPKQVLGKADELRTIETVNILIAMLYTIKNHLRAEWGVALSPGTSLGVDGQETDEAEYKDLLPMGLKGYEHRGLGLTIELSTFVEVTSSSILPKLRILITLIELHSAGCEEVSGLLVFLVYLDAMLT
jgi:putative membrane protein